MSAGEDGDFFLDTRGGGVLNLRLELRRRVERRLLRRSVDLQPATLDTAALGPGQVIMLTVDPDLLQSVLDEIGR